MKIEAHCRKFYLLKWLTSKEKIMTTMKSQQQFDFYGRHLLLNFSGCEADLNDLGRIRHDMIDAVNAIGATILSHVTIIFMLSESHASVHTYPEHQACFLDIFTCGETIIVEPFGALLEERWKPCYVAKQKQKRFGQVLAGKLWI
jgi:S-adenosylmethionine decarboxylase